MSIEINWDQDICEWKNATAENKFANNGDMIFSSYIPFVEKAKPKEFSMVSGTVNWISVLSYGNTPKYEENGIKMLLVRAGTANDRLFFPYYCIDVVGCPI